MLEVIFWLSVISIFYTYIVYPVLIWIIAALFPWRQREGTIYSLPKVSLLFSAYNEGKIIEEKVINCLSLDYPRESLEVIIGSDGSTDNTESIVNKFSGQGIILYRSKQRMGKVNVLNVLKRMASGDILVLCDANSIFDPQALKELVKGFSDKRVGCVCGKLSLRDNKFAAGGELEGVYWRYESFIKEQEGRLGVLLGANGGIYAVRKELFYDLAPNTIVEDFVLPLKILQGGHRVLYEPKALASEESSKYIEEEKTRKIRIGAGDYQALFMTLPMLNIFKGLSSFVYWSHKVIRWFAPFLLLVAFIANCFLVSRAESFAYLLVLQLIFYLSSWAGWYLNRRGWPIKVFLLSYYFVAMHISLLQGFINFISGRQKVTWKRVER
ncbi:MAG: Poly-beta-1,6-N-acetyl-D-glucosamine synthase [Pelotomaculum sp. PtaU1.Bin065]|nr:MAG: Poly-beta-1,6-N-acetyl-D-glucosamine synthase [Pelotomaculum sp. PtaU1.Bin065]